MSENEKKSARDRELDDFWDIGSLLPEKRKSLPPPPRDPANIDAVEISFGDEAPKESKDAKFTVDLGKIVEDSRSRRTEQRTTTSAAQNVKRQEALTSEKPTEPFDDYAPDHTLIDRVKIYRAASEYSYYGKFLEHAEKIVMLHGHECDEVPFFSYVPQYTQLSKPQLDWYLWWRESVWHGNFMRTDYSYILLYIYEIINTGGHGKPEWGQLQLCNIWLAYRRDFPRFDKLLGEWICDFSLIYHLAPPTKHIRKILNSALPSCSLKEFYVASDTTERNDISSAIMLTYCSNYDYNSSKFAVGDAKPLYDKHIPGALCAVIEHFSSGENELIPGVGLEKTHIFREAYAGALCSYAIRMRFELDYLSFRRSYGLRYVIRDIVKYSENRIRGYIGVRSRLSVGNLDAEIRSCLDAYFDRELPRRSRDDESMPREYDRLYDAPKTPISFEHAAEIEQTSWETTERLVEAFEDDEKQGIDLSVQNSEMPVASAEEFVPILQTPFAATPTAVPETAKSPAEAEMPTDEKTPLAAALGEYLAFVRLADKHDFGGEHRFAAEHHEIIDLISDKINEIAVDIFGDVILEEAGGGYILIDEYRKEVLDG